MTAAPGPSDVIAILGIARSGTSALSGALAAMGVDFGQQLKPADWQNPKGNFEHAGLSQLNQDLLAIFGLNWSSARPLPENWLDHRDVRDIANSIQRVIERDFQHARLFAIKDPRLVQLWPLYSQLLSDQFRVSTVVMERSREEVIRSIRKSGYLHGFPYPGRLKRLYDFYMQQLVAQRQTETAICVRHADLIYKPEETLGQLAGSLPFGAAGIVPDIAKGVAFIDRALHRQRQASAGRAV